MKFNPGIDKGIQEILEKQYKEYIKVTPMTKKEQRALREWVKAGHSVYENSSGVWAEGQVPVEFLKVYRDEEYIRTNTKGMSPEESIRFTMIYYAWNEDASDSNASDEDYISFIKELDSIESNEELPLH